MHAAILMLLSPELCLSENRKVVHRHFRSETGKLLDERSNLVDQWTALLFDSETLKKLLIDESSKFSSVACFSEKAGVNHVNWTNITAHDFGFRYCAADRERSYVQRNFGSVTVNRCVVQYRIGDDVGRGGRGGEVTERSRALFFPHRSRP